MLIIDLVELSERSKSHWTLYFGKPSTHW